MIRFNTMVNTTQTETMVITNGNVGIGTFTNPDYKLKIEESTAMRANVGITFRSINDSSIIRTVNNPVDPDIRNLSFGEGQFFHLSTNDNRVNIGTTYPQTQFEVHDTTQWSETPELRLSGVVDISLKNYLVYN